MNFAEIEAQAESRIVAHRTADFEISLRDAVGAPIPHAKVVVHLARHDFRLGANGFLIRGGGARRQEQDSAGVLTLEYEKAFAGVLNYATLPFYWGGYEPESGKDSTERLRGMAEWCRRHGIRTKGHPLAWHEVFPKWAEALDDGEVLRLLRSRISRIVREFHGIVDSWDVFNETTVASHFSNAVGRWVKDKGAAECVAEALRLAREADPRAELLYNDFNVSQDFEELVMRLRECGAPFDAIGIQSHMHTGVWSAEKIWETCETYARFGLPLHFTEATILSGRLKAPDDKDWHKVHPDWATTSAGEQRQLEEGRRFYTLLFSHPAVEAVTWWDFSDRRAWQGAPSGLVRKDMTLKPLAEWLRDSFLGRWTTRAELESDGSGIVRFRGFFGDYTIQSTVSTGISLAGACRFPRRGARRTEAVLD